MLREDIVNEIERLKENNNKVLHLPRYDKQRKKLLDKNSQKIEALKKELNNMIVKDDEVFELVCITSVEYDPNEEVEMSMGFYSCQEIANWQKEKCELQAEEDNQDLKYEVKNHTVIL